MSTYQHRISFKGSEDSIDHFTKLLRDAKDIFGVNSAEIILAATAHWIKRPLASALPRCNAQSRTGCSRIFYLQVLTTAFIVSRLNSELDKLRRDPTLRIMLEPHRVGRQEFLLEALIVVLEFYRSSSSPLTCRKLHPFHETDSTNLPFYQTKSSLPTYVSNYEQNLVNEQDICALKPQSIKLFDNHIPDNMNHLNNTSIRNHPARYTGSKSSHQLVLEETNFNNYVPARNLTPECSPRCSSVEISDRGRCKSIGLEPENRHLVSWRQRLREQQLAENRRLTESIRSRSSASRQNSVERTEPETPTHRYSAVQTEDRLDNNNKVYSNIIKDNRAKMSEVFSRTISKPPLPPQSPKIDRNNNCCDTNDNTWRTHYRSAFLREASDPPRPKATIEIKPVEPIRQTSFLQGPKLKSNLRNRFEEILNPNREPILTLRERNLKCDQLSHYLEISPAEIRHVPGFEEPFTNFQRTKEGIDCDEVYPGIILGNGATLKKKDYLFRIGITHILNAAEYRGVNIDKDFFKGDVHYMGLRVEDTPQTQICRYFLDVAEFIDEALLNHGKIFVNCVFGKSRSTTCIVAYLMLAQNWPALKSLEHVRRKRSVKLNFGFLQQIADLESKLEPYRNKT